MSTTRGSVIGVITVVLGVIAGLVGLVSAVWLIAARPVSDVVTALLVGAFTLGIVLAVPFLGPHIVKWKAWKFLLIGGGGALAATLLLLALLQVLDSGPEKAMSPASRTPAMPEPSSSAVSPTPSVVSPTPSFVEGVSRLQEGSDVSLFTEVLGEPGYRRAILKPDGEKAYSSREWGWSDGETYMIRAVVDNAQQVEAFSVTTLSEDFQPPLSYLAEVAGQPLGLGLTTFAELSAAFDQELSPAGRDTAGIATNGRWYYSEYYSIPNPLYRTFTASYGFTGSGLNLDDTDDPGPVLAAIEYCEPQPCLGAVYDIEEVDRARSAWPITTFTVLGDIGNVPGHLRVLTAEPLDDDIEAADR